MKLSQIITLSVLIITSIGIWYYVRHRCTPTIQRSEKTVLRIGTNTEYEPFSYISDCGLVTGLDIDVALAVAHVLGITPIIENMSFNALVPQLQTGNIDIIAAGITPTIERARYVDFATAHVSATENPLVVVSLKNHPLTSLEDFTGTTIAVNLGYASDYVMSTYNQKHPDFTIMRLGSGYINEGFMALHSGRAQGFVAARIAVMPLLRNAPPDCYHITPLPLTGEASALVISPHRKDLTPEINQALKQLEATGVLIQLKKKYGIIE